MPKFIPFRQGYMKYINDSRLKENKINILEGSVRSSKTVVNLLCFALEIEEMDGDLFLAVGKSVDQAKKVIGESDGLGLAHLLEGAEYKDGNKLVYTDAIGRQKTILFVGGTNKNSYESFHGMTTYGTYITEIQLMHRDTIVNAKQRMLKTRYAKMFIDLNPVSANHPVYTEFLDGWIAMGANYKHVTMMDNPIFSREHIIEAMVEYADTNSVLYKRNILGQRINADGIIFTGYSREKLQIGSIQGLQFHDFSVGVDFGTRDATTFTLVGFRENYKYATVIATYYHKNPKQGAKKGAVEYIEDFVKWINPLRAKYPTLKNVWVDSASGGFKTSLAIKLKAISNLKVLDSQKGTIVDRIVFVEQMMTLGALEIHKDCENLFDSLGSQMWDSVAQEKGKDERLDNGTTDIDSADSFEYAVYPYRNKMLPRWHYKG